MDKLATIHREDYTKCPQRGRNGHSMAARRLAASAPLWTLPDTSRLVSTVLKAAVLDLATSSTNICNHK